MTEPLSLDTVNQLAALIYQMSPEEARQQALRMQREQPVLFRFLAALNRPPFNPEEHAYVVTLGLTFWLVLEQSGRPPARVSEEVLLRASNAMDAMVERLAALPPEERQAGVVLEVTSYPEPGLLAYLVAALQQKADPPLRHESKLIAQRHLRVLLDAMLSSRAPVRRPARRRSARRPTGRA